MHLSAYSITSEHTEILVQTGRCRDACSRGRLRHPPRTHTRMSWQLTSPHINSGPEYHTDTNNRAGNPSIPRNVTNTPILVSVLTCPCRGVLLELRRNLKRALEKGLTPTGGITKHNLPLVVHYCVLCMTK